MMLALVCALTHGASVRARLATYTPYLAQHTVRKWEDDDDDVPAARPPWLPAYVLHVDERPQAALFFDATGGQHRALHLVYNATVMRRPGYMAAFRRLIDRAADMYYDDLPFAHWLALVPFTDAPEADGGDDEKEEGASASRGRSA